MCGRYAFFSPAEAVRRSFAVEAVPALEPRYNVAPTQAVPAVAADVQSAEQQSPPAVLPSSQASPTLRLPSPHRDV